MTNIWFVRHAEPNYGNHDDASRELTEKGQGDTALVTAFLQDKGISAVYSSPYKRAVDTVKPFADAAGLPVFIDPDFRERRVDSIWIDDFDSFCRQQWLDFDYCLSDGEPLHAVQTRNINALCRLLAKHSGQSIVVGSHGTALSTIIRYFDPGFGYEDFKAIQKLMPWVVRFTFSGTECISITEYDIFTGQANCRRPKKKGNDSMIKAVIFDMDGTIADTLASIAGFGNAALAAHGFPTLEVELYRQLVGNGADVLMRRMLAATGKEHDEDTVKALRKTYDALYEADPTKLVTPYPGILEMLHTVRAAGIKTAILSNKPDNMTCYIANALFHGLFDIVHGQRADFPKKPDPTAVLSICDELGVTPADCLYVGDSGVDMQTGNNAGIESVGVTWGFRGVDELRENGAHHIADTAAELLSVIM